MKNKLNVVQIKSKVSKIHKEFIASVGIIPDMLDADRFLLLNRVSAKIIMVLKCFQEEKIIDQFVVNENTAMYITYKLLKDGFTTSVLLSTDGKNIVARNSNFLIETERMAAFKSTKIDIEDPDTSDWEAIAIELLNYIHSVMYHRVESFDTKLSNKFKD